MNIHANVHFVSVCMFVDASLCFCMRLYVCIEVRGCVSLIISIEVVNKPPLNKG